MCVRATRIGGRILTSYAPHAWAILRSNAGTASTSPCPSTILAIRIHEPTLLLEGKFQLSRKWLKADAIRLQLTESQEVPHRVKVITDHLSNLLIYRRNVRFPVFRFHRKYHIVR